MEINDALSLSVRQARSLALCRLTKDFGPPRTGEGPYPTQDLSGTPGLFVEFAAGPWLLLARSAGPQGARSMKILRFMASIGGGVAWR